jgi:hypothetical protein
VSRNDGGGWFFVDFEALSRRFGRPEDVSAGSGVGRRWLGPEQCGGCPGRRRRDASTACRLNVCDLSLKPRPRVRAGVLGSPTPHDRVRQGQRRGRRLRGRPREGAGVLSTF